MKEKTKQLLDLEVQQKNLDNETQPTQDLPNEETGKPLREAIAALDAIEWITADDFIEDLEMQVAFHSEGMPADLVTACEKLCKVYAIAHAESPNHSCHHVHDDWRKIKHEILHAKAKSEPLRKPKSGSSTVAGEKENQSTLIDKKDLGER